jgi:hypothetical protein
MWKCREEGFFPNFNINELDSLLLAKEKKETVYFLYLLV